MRAIRTTSKIMHFKTFCMVYLFAVFFSQLTLPYGWQESMPDMFFLTWCLWLVHDRQHGKHPHWFAAWFFGLSVDFWTSPFLGPQAWIYCAMAMLMEVRSSHLAKDVSHLWFECTLMFIFATLLRSAIGMWASNLLPLPGVVQWLLTYFIGIFVVMSPSM